ncbi:exo-1,3-beta-D-glucanase [Acrodontium crateriforme]|uniref:Exo-1,3-beta-D-glucanase n=1 Tax=Acrodontium crateriforme TaxID=150365 RepID=A0AAQ3M7J3_9PEZI|nr:exo-1,3-beta-D-glucanase [Acrodontium crateriforme]
MTDTSDAVAPIVAQDGAHYGSFAALAPRSAGLVTAGPNHGPKNPYFYKSRPQYEKLSVGSVVNVKDRGALGNGAHDDTEAIKSALSEATADNLIYFPAGSYIITSTIIVPPHARITGQVWSQLVASGSYFGDIKSPKVMLQVGNVGDKGTVEISDMLFTSTGALPGLILVEWNV